MSGDDDDELGLPVGFTIIDDDDGTGLGGAVDGIVEPAIGFDEWCRLTGFDLPAARTTATATASDERPTRLHPRPHHTMRGLLGRVECGAAESIEDCDRCGTAGAGTAALHRQSCSPGNAPSRRVNACVRKDPDCRFLYS